MGTENQFRTDFLFSEGSLLLGVGSVFDLSGTYFEYNTSPNGRIADYAAINSDWGVVGQDMRKAISLAEKTNGAESR